MDITLILPEDCISHIISLTSPRDACRLTVVSPVFKSAAESDTVWEMFLPSDYLEILSTSVSASSLTTSFSKKKDLYFHLCHNPILVSGGTMSFALEKESGKKCYMICAREFAIEWGNTPSYWIWPSLPESMFAEAAELKIVWWFDIKARVETKILSSKTNYGAYLVFKFAETRYGFKERLVDFEVYFEGSGNGERRRALLDLPPNMLPLSQERGDGWMEIEMDEFFIENGDYGKVMVPLSRERGDGWMEIEMGEFFNENGDDGKVVCSVFDFDGFRRKGGIIIQGIELRPENSPC
ncbi:F-box protein [Melia azedarach]|uniref:F-box protein n=1 Tax=Melia azedarach TaxID=155640 RepID=A0ACC1YIH3_MELAZ|nr:F-box protein [Melia azedarach]